MTNEADLVGKRAVIVEDEGITQLQIRKILWAEGVEVVGTAARGEDAIGLVLETKPDFVLMDIRMPGIGGMEATRQILEQFRTCIIMLTAFPANELREDALALGAAGYILKPITASTLVPQVKSALRAWQSGST